MEKLEAMRLLKAAKVVRDGVEETLSYMAFPAADPHQQSPGENDAGDSSADTRGRGLPRRSVGTDAGCRPTTTHRRHPLGHATIPRGLDNRNKRQLSRRCRKSRRV